MGKTFEALERFKKDQQQGESSRKVKDVVYEEKLDDDPTAGKANLVKLKKIIELRKTKRNKAERINNHDRRSNAEAVNESIPEDLTSRDARFQKEIYARPIGHCRIFKLEKPFVNKIYVFENRTV